MASQEDEDEVTRDIDVSLPQTQRQQSRREVAFTQRDADIPPTEGAQYHGYSPAVDFILPELDPPGFQIPSIPRASRTPRPQRIQYRRHRVETWLDDVIEQSELSLNQDDAALDMCNITRRVSSDSLSEQRFSPLNLPFANRPYADTIEVNLPVPEVPPLSPIVMARLGISIPGTSQRTQTIDETNPDVETIMPPRRMAPSTSRSSLPRPVPVGESLHVKKKRSTSKVPTSSTSPSTHSKATCSSSTHPILNVTPRAESPTPDIDIRVVLHPTRRRMGPTASETITSANASDLQYEPVKLEATKSDDTVTAPSPRYSITEVLPDTQSETSTLMPASQTASEDMICRRTSAGKPLVINPFYTPSSSTTSAVPSTSRMRAEPTLSRETRTTVNEISRIITVRNPRTNEVQEYWVRRNAQLLSEVAGSLHDTTVAPRAAKRGTASTVVVKKMMRVDQPKKKNLKGIKRIPSKTIDSSSSSTESPRPTARSLSPQQRDAPPAYDPTKYTPPRGPRYERIRALRMRPKRVRRVDDTESSGYPTWEDAKSKPSSTALSELHPIGSESSTDVDLPEISLQEKVESYLSNVNSQIDDNDNDE